MVRTFMNKKKVEYTVYSNQGTPSVYVDGEMVGTVVDGVCKWFAKPYKKDVIITLTGVTIPSTSVVSGWDHGNEVDGVFLGWQGQYPLFTGYNCTHTYRFISGRYNDTYSNSPVTSGTLIKGSKELIINHSSYKQSREWYDTDLVTYDNKGDQSSDPWDGSIIVSGDLITVHYGSAGRLAVMVNINGRWDYKSMDFSATWKHRH